MGLKPGIICLSGTGWMKEGQHPLSLATPTINGIAVGNKATTERGQRRKGKRGEKGQMQHLCCTSLMYWLVAARHC